MHKIKSVRVCRQLERKRMGVEKTASYKTARHKLLKKTILIGTCVFLFEIFRLGNMLSFYCSITIDLLFSALNLNLNMLIRVMLIKKSCTLLN